MSNSAGRAVVRARAMAPWCTHGVEVPVPGTRYAALEEVALSGSEAGKRKSAKGAIFLFGWILCIKLMLENDD